MADAESQERYFDGEEYWESESLAWIHRVRREIDKEQPLESRKPASPAKVRQLARKYGLRILVEPESVKR